MKSHGFRWFASPNATKSVLIFMWTEVQQRFTTIYPAELVPSVTHHDWWGEGIWWIRFGARLALQSKGGRRFFTRIVQFWCWTCVDLHGLVDRSRAGSILQDYSCSPHPAGIQQLHHLVQWDFSGSSVNPFWNKMIPAKVRWGEGTSTTPGENVSHVWATFCGNRLLWTELGIGL